MKLSDFELDVMQHFWREGNCSAKQIHQWICEQKPSAYTTVKTIIDRLEEKGALVRVGKEGRAIVYKAGITSEAMQPEVVPSFLKRFFAGNAGSLIAHLLEDDKLSDKDIDYLDQYLQEKKQKNGKK